MPDGDVFTRAVRAPWRVLACALRDGLPVDECVRRLEDSLAKHLRATQGLHCADLQRLLGEVACVADERRIIHALEEVARHRAFERVVPLLIGKGRFPTYDAAATFIRTCFDRARLDVLARSLARRPDATGLRRPAQRRRTTVELLAESAPPGALA